MSSAAEEVPEGSEAEIGAEELPEGSDDCCWICGALVVNRHCKIVCPRCGFMRDCSDP